ncbi:hypothetical protein E2C01_044194 [Portunus trituberculatus]|uniref:Uncharacterized protein n=1 Tax=Portunus trituberculatus TaxID=210409 RepID=A0A5B7FXR0_PORTR|nr:hypothetical protein [Portunus trituberculatus]
MESRRAFHCAPGHWSWCRGRRILVDSQPVPLDWRCTRVVTPLLHTLTSRQPLNTGAKNALSSEPFLKFYNAIAATPANLTYSWQCFLHLWCVVVVVVS